MVTGRGGSAAPISFDRDRHRRHHRDHDRHRRHHCRRRHSRHTPNRNSTPNPNPNPNPDPNPNPNPRPDLEAIDAGEWEDALGTSKPREGARWLVYDWDGLNTLSRFCVPQNFRVAREKAWRENQVCLISVV